MTVFDRTKEISKKRGMSLQQVAEKSGIGRNSIYHWKTQNPSIGNLNKVAKTLNISADYLLGTAEDQSSSEQTKEIDLKNAMNSEHTMMSWDGKQIPPEELEIIRRILDGGKNK
ncbi:helix-turn-helix domain-containing protein [Companilactobacillus ginsenosidimutans]|uniref:HTH cro/C1-type domain-containing protein n=1 Tax=Companilactobacillus ginsenosidimutans TaxID=1007676 RepID=A0A0H4QH09_9LACO|nr:helix-turn-helix domain-containing protein [Companilactobacillus ginsenosidimutans]AKP67699.1 hypothetical protein ABM34_09275 [Companilactobacillus ginsenosidimutans]